MSLWIIFMSEHLDPPSALSDHCESVAWLIINGPHIAAYRCKLGPNLFKRECLRLETNANIFQQSHATANCAGPPITKDMKTLVTRAYMRGGCITSCFASFHCVGIACNAHAVPTQCARTVHTVHQLGLGVFDPEAANRGTRGWPQATVPRRSPCHLQPATSSPVPIHRMRPSSKTRGRFTALWTWREWHVFAVLSWFH